MKQQRKGSAEPEFQQRNHQSDITDGESNQRADGIDEESLFQPLDESTPSSRRGSEARRQPQEEPISPSVTALSRSKDDPEDSANEAMFARLELLQKEVERMRDEEELRLAKQQDLERENARFRDDNHKAQQRIKQLEQLQRTSREPSRERSLEAGVLNRELIKSKERVSDLIHQVQHQQNRANAIQAEFDSYREKHLTETARLEDEVREQISVAQSESKKSLIIAQEAADLADAKEQSEQTVRDLEDRLQEQTAVAKAESNRSLDIAREAAKLSECKEKHEKTIQQLQREAEAVSSELDEVQDQLQESRRIIGDVEDENERLSEVNNSQSQELKVIREELQARATEVRAAHSTIATLRDDQAQKVGGDDERTTAIDSIAQDFESQIASLKAQHAIEVETMRSAFQKTTTTRKNREAELKNSHSAEVMKLHQQIDDLKGELRSAQEEPSTHSVEDELRSAIRVLSNKLSKANESTKTARAEREEARQYAASIEETNHAVNAELEIRFAQAMEAREQEWQRRAQLLFKERDRMGKVLLHSWGRKEVGMKRGEKQAYRYKYSK